MDIRVMTPDEQRYTYAQSQQLRGQTGSIGHLRGDFGTNGAGFYTSWFDHQPDLKTTRFRYDLDAVITELRTEHLGLLQSRNAMLNYVGQQPDSRMGSDRSSQFGFRVDTEKYAFLFRCNPARGDYNFYCFCYVKEWLDHHIQEASRGIRFIDPNYKELFRIPDGGQIIVTSAGGTRMTKTCRYIDETHVEVSGELFHICEYAERLQNAGAVCEPKQAVKAAKTKDFER